LSSYEINTTRHFVNSTNSQYYFDVFATICILSRSNFVIARVIIAIITIIIIIVTIITTIIIIIIIHLGPTTFWGYAQWVEVLRYKPEGRRYDSRWGF
jgi:lipopolysaccharide/colanic/teichoic acid biosynthesis glycosyltransferase